MGTPGKLIGSVISLVSNKDIRYEGVLYAIDQEKSSVTLQSVKCFGTEGRTGAGQEYLPDDKVYDYILFEASDIKDLHVHEAASAPAPAPSPAKDVPSSTPSPTQQPSQQQQPLTKSAPPQRQQQQQARPAAGGRGGASRGGRGSYGGGRGGVRGRGGREGGGALPGTGGHLLGRRGKTEGGASGGPEKGQGEFDFESALQGFNKEEEMAKLSVKEEAGGEGGAVGSEGTGGAAGEGTIPEVKKYDKSSFFDDLSTGPGAGGRPSMAEERKTNMDTFGVAALHNPQHRRYGGRGGGRGGPYRGGGGGRGGGRGRGGGYRGGRGGGRGGYASAQGGGNGPPPAKVSV